MGTAAHAIAGRHGVSASTVYLAATAGLVGALTHGKTAGLRTVVSNRFYPDRREAVAAIAQDGVLVLDLAVPTFGELIQLAWRETKRANRFARYDPDLLAGAVSAATVRVLRRLAAAPPRGPGAAGRGGAAGGRGTVSSADLDAAPGTERVRRAGGRRRGDRAGGQRLMVAADLERWLRALEGLLISAAYRDVAAGELAALLAGGVRPRA